MSRTVMRRVVQADALAWLAAEPVLPDASVITSLPDVSETPDKTEASWKDWFVDAARAVLRFVPVEGQTIFFQSDVRVGGVWIDKGYLVQRAAELEGASLVWHKIVCRQPAGTIALGRPSFSHMLCFTRAARGSWRPPQKPGPDVLSHAGFMPWSRAMGLEACRVACRYLAENTPTRIVVDPFCGRGSVLAVANAMGFDAVGVDLSAKRCRAARRMTIDDLEAGGARR